jgi:hypothetical protein
MFLAVIFTAEKLRRPMLLHDFESLMRQFPILFDRDSVKQAQKVGNEVEFLVHFLLIPQTGSGAIGCHDPFINSNA